MKWLGRKVRAPQLAKHSSEGAGRIARGPSIRQLYGDVAHRFRRRALEVVGAEAVCDLEVCARLTHLATATQARPAFELFKRAVKADEVDVEALEGQDKASHPVFGFDDVFDDEVVTGSGEGGDAVVKAFEELLSQARPRELTALNSGAWEHSRGNQMINGVMPKRQGELLLQG